MLLSDLSNEIRSLEIKEIINEVNFDYFSRITTKTDNKKNSSICVYLENDKYIDDISPNVKMIITNEKICKQLSSKQYGICVSDNPKTTYSKCLDHFNKLHEKQLNNKTVIGRNCNISNLAYIAQDNVIIGDNVTIEEFVCIYGNTIIGNDCVIKSGAKIGIQDYNYYFENNIANHIFHAGAVKIGNNVEIGCNDVIGRALFSYHETSIGDNCKIGANVCIGHDSLVGSNVMIYCGTSIAGNCNIGDFSIITLGVNIKNGLTIGKKSTLDMGSVVIRNVEDGDRVFGNPAKRVIIPK